MCAIYNIISYSDPNYSGLITIEKTAPTVYNNANSRSDIMYGHIHMAKTGGSTLNGMFANKFERVCGNKGYSLTAYRDNERAKSMPNGTLVGNAMKNGINEVNVGFENCDYMSYEVDWKFWIRNFGNGKFHGIPMELHVPCRSPIDHLMSQCNHGHKQMLDCNADTDAAFFESVDKCELFLTYRYHHDIENYHDVKCMDFAKQFTNYVNYMSSDGRLQMRRLESKPFIKRVINQARNKTNECIWGRPDLLKKTNTYLLKKYHYYQFCDTCMGSENEITRDKIE